MKTIGKLKLNQLSKTEKVELNNRAMQSLRGGKCGWKCFWDFDTSKAVRENTSSDYCAAQYGC
jgi:natural product precursor